MVYYARALCLVEKDRLGRALAVDAKLPLVLARANPGQCKAWTAAGAFSLPDDSAKLLGADHPFLEEATADLIELCHHPDAGDFVVSGWRTGHPAMSFAVENGSHGGFGPNETRGFAALPKDAPVSAETPYVRPSDLRRGALQHLGQEQRLPAMTRYLRGKSAVLAERGRDPATPGGADGTSQTREGARTLASSQMRRSHMRQIQLHQVGHFGPKPSVRGKRDERPLSDP